MSIINGTAGPCKLVDIVPDDNEDPVEPCDSLSAGGKTHLITELRDEFGRSSGYTYAKDGATQQSVNYGYATDGRLNTAGFLHGGEQKNFSYGYLPGTNLLQSLAMPNNMTLTQSYEAQRDLLTGMDYKRGEILISRRTYAYDTLGIPTARSTNRQGTTRNDAFTHNDRQELTAATLGTDNYAYAYDNIGNRKTAQEVSEEVTQYNANNLNQYTAIDEFVPTYDADGNQTKIQTSTGIWNVTYNALNRPVLFTSADGATSVECSYDYMGRRATKKVTVNGEVTLHQRYLYRGYLQIACVDLTRTEHPCLWLITWDPAQPVATRPLAIQKDGTWYTYGIDLTKNICEVFGPAGYIRTAYTYTPFGTVTAEGDVTQPIQWSSEYADEELGLIYYNYRHYNAKDGRWINRDPIGEEGGRNLYISTQNNTINIEDFIGLKLTKIPLNKEYEIICSKKYIDDGKIGKTKADFKVRFDYNGVENIGGKLLVVGTLNMTVQVVKNEKMEITKKHEHVHVRINRKYWNKLADDINFLESYWCDECAGLAIKYGNQINTIRTLEANVENLLFDVNDYKRSNVKKEDINEVIIKYKNTLNELKKEGAKYNDIAIDFGRKCTDKQLYIFYTSSITHPEDPVIKNYKFPYKLS